MPASSVRFEDVNPDPVLTKFAVQYGAGGGFVMDSIAPVLNVQSRNYKYPRYAADQLDTDDKIEVAPGGRPNTTSFRLPSFVTGSVIRRAIDSAINRDGVELADPSPLSSEETHIAKIVHRIKIRIEKAGKALLDAGSYSASPSTKWDAGGNTIEKNIDDAKEAFEVRCGVPATHLIMPRAVANVVKRDSNIRALRKSTNDNLLTNGELPFQIFGINVIIPGALENTANPGASQSLARLWATDTCYFVHVNPSISRDGSTLTTLAQMRWSAFDAPWLALRWQEPHRSQFVDWVSCGIYQNEELVAPDALYLLTDCLT